VAFPIVQGFGRLGLFVALTHSGLPSGSLTAV
jgi:hypothetical protein